MKQFYSIHEFLDAPEFRKRPGMYLGKPTASGLFMFLLGYSYCEEFNNLRPRDTCPPFIMFLPWVAKQTNQSIGSVNWDTLLLEKNNGNEEKAFNEFFIHYDSFKRQKPIYIQKAIITETEKAFFTAHQEEPWKNKPADTIYIINYSGDFGCSTHTKQSSKWYERWEYEFEPTVNYLKSLYGNTLQFETIPKKDIPTIYKRIDMQLL